MHLFFGGSFDPIHTGHLVVAMDVLETLKASKLTFIPTYQAPLKDPHQATPEDRLNMIKLAVSKMSHFQVSDMEIKRGGISYTVDTVMELLELNKKRPYLMVGADSLFSLHMWKEPYKLTSSARLIIVDRLGKAREVSDYLRSNFPHLREDQDYIILDVRRIDISSTEIRDRVKMGRSIRWLVPPEVESYILERGIYR